MLSPRKQPDLFANPRAARAALADEIERLMDALDALDGDPDLEDGHDAEADGADAEPALGWTDDEARFGCYGANHPGEDEDDDEDTDIADQPHDEEPDAEPAQCHIWGGAE